MYTAFMAGGFAYGVVHARILPHPDRKNQFFARETVDKRKKFPYHQYKTAKKRNSKSGVGSPERMRQVGASVQRVLNRSLERLP